MSRTKIVAEPSNVTRSNSITKKTYKLENIQTCKKIYMSSLTRREEGGRQLIASFLDPIKPWRHLWTTQKYGNFSLWKRDKSKRNNLLLLNFIQSFFFHLHLKVESKHFEHFVIELELDCFDWGRVRPRQLQFSKHRCEHFNFNLLYNNASFFDRRII